MPGENHRVRGMVLASVANHCSRFEDVLTAMQPYVLSDPSFNEEERRIYAKANREIFIKKKNQILKLVLSEKAIREQSPPNSNRLVKLVSDMRGQIETEFKVAVFELIDLLENYMLNRTYNGDPSAPADYLLLKADIWKYFWEICAEKDKANSLETSQLAYEKAIKEAKVLHPTHPTRLRSSYAYVALMDGLNPAPGSRIVSKQRLVKVAREAMHPAVMQLEEVDPLIRYESVQLLQLLKEFILQKGDEQEEEL